MKKLMILAVAAALVGLSLPQNVSAQAPTTTQDEQGTQQNTEGTQSTGTNSEGTGSGSVGTGSGSIGTGSSTGSAAVSNYTEMKSTDLPSAVSLSLSEKYPEYTTDKVYRGKDGTYKITLSKDNVKETVFFDQRGDAIKMQKKVE